MSERPQATEGDWLEHLKSLPEPQASVVLEQLQPGDELWVVTRNTRYHLIWTGGREAMLSSNRDDRPQGPVVVHGCALGAGSSIAIDRLFVGGSLEISDADRSYVHTTSTIGLLIHRERRIAE